MAATTMQDTTREPRIALGVALQRTRPGRASIADVAAALNVITAVIGEQDDPPPPRHRRRTSRPDPGAGGRRV